MATITQWPVFDLVRERLGARLSLLNVVASFFLNTLALVAELCGVALGIELATDMHYLLWVPLVALVAFLVMWRLPFEHMERLYGLVGCSCSCSSSLLAGWGEPASSRRRPRAPSPSPSRIWARRASTLSSAVVGHAGGPKLGRTAGARPRSGR